MPSAAVAPGTMGIELQRTFRASPERVFRAWTQPAALREWWCPPGWVAGEIEIDLRVGGTYSVAMSRAGSAGSLVSVSGQFLEVRPPERLVYTWRWEGAFAEMPETLVILELRGSNNETVLTLHHDKFVDAGSAPAAPQRLDGGLRSPRSRGNSGVRAARSRGGGALKRKRAP